MSVIEVPKMQPVAKELWTTALDSGEYSQINGQLFNGRGYCCLGVAAKVLGCTLTYELPSGHGSSCRVEAPEMGDVNCGGLLEQHYADKVGITAQMQTLLSHLNDGGTVSLQRSDPLYALAEALADSDTPSEFDDDRTAFHLPRMDFKQISQLIKDNF